MWLMRECVWIHNESPVAIPFRSKFDDFGSSRGEKNTKTLFANVDLGFFLLFEPFTWHNEVKKRSNGARKVSVMNYQTISKRF